MATRQVIEIEISHNGWGKKLSVASITKFIAQGFEDNKVEVNRITVKDKRT